MTGNQEKSAEQPEKSAITLRKPMKSEDEESTAVSGSKRKDGPEYLCKLITPRYENGNVIEFARNGMEIREFYG
jgi:hypothetical protein